jgi:hypothetical protein
MKAAVVKNEEFRVEQEMRQLQDILNVIETRDSEIKSVSILRGGGSGEISKTCIGIGHFERIQRNGRIPNLESD